MSDWLTSPDYRAVVAALIKVRTDAGLTQRALAAQLGIDHSIIAKVEMAQRNVSVVDFIAWCRAGKVDPAHVIQGLNGTP